MNLTGHLLSSFNALGTPLSISSPLNYTQNVSSRFHMDPNTHQSYVRSNPDTQGDKSSTQKLEELGDADKYWEDKQQDSA